jgi:hypothetical protein
MIYGVVFDLMLRLCYLIGSGLKFLWALWMLNLVREVTIR